MDGMTSQSSTGAVALILSNLNELALSTVDSFKRFMYSFEVMQSIDWTTMLLFFWLLFGLFVYTIGNIIYIVINKRKCAINENSCLSESDNSQDCVDEKLQKTSVNSGVFADKLQKKPSIAIASGPDSQCVSFINQIIQWFYSQNDPNIEQILNVWFTALNNKSKKLSTENGFSIEFVELVREQSIAPELTNVCVDLENNENITTTCKISSPRILLLIKVIRENGSTNEELSQYEFKIERFEGMMKTVCINEESLLVIRFTERPDLRGTLKSLKAQQQKSDNRVSEDAIIDAILQVITTTVVDLCLSGYKDFPKIERNAAQKEAFSHNKKVERKLFVKVVKANCLGNNKGNRDPYCVIEVDEPTQRVQTSAIKETTNPIWNEHFIFNLEEESSEVLFELYDKQKNGNDNFLGLGIVSVSELKTNPSQKQIISLQPRPLELDEISGSLTVEFLFMEHSSDTPLTDSNTSKVSPISCSPTNDGKETEQTINVEPNEEVMQSLVCNEVNEYTGNDSSLTEVENTEVKKNLNEIEFTLTEASEKGLESKPITQNSNKNTLNVQNPQRTSENGGSEGYGTGRGTPDPSHTDGSMISSANSNKSDRSRRSRSKEPRSIIRAIRKRFSFNKNRSKSVEIRTDKESEPNSRDSSVSSTSDRARSMPSSREPSSPKETVANNALKPGVTKVKTESFSNLSEISGYSTRTFVHEKSTLIVEAVDSGVLKHYIIPISLANKSKWRKRGVKLHLFNDHLFVAKHLSGSITCQVCGKLFSRRPGKQGYQCRDCDYMCHKRCHIQVDNRCTKSTISSLKLECVIDPKMSKLDKNDVKEVNEKPTVES